MRSLARWEIILGIGMTLVACNGSGANESASGQAPTRTLIPPTATLTPLPVEATPAPTDLPAPSALVGAPTEEGVEAIPSDAQALIEQVVGDLVTERELDPADVRLLSLERFIWPDASWGCRARYDEGYTESGTVRGYRLVFGTDRRAYVVHSGADGAFFVCEDRDWLRLEGEPIPLDPIAQFMVDLTARDAARRLDIPPEDLTLVSLIALTWPDSSIGCPKSNAEYANDPTPGYRIVFRAVEQPLIYHTSIREIARCAPDEEILPGFLRQALPSPGS
jgi:hypothetical protein